MLLASSLLIALGWLAPQAESPAADPLEQRIERIDLVDVPLREALRLLADESGVNLIASEGAATKTISCLLQDVSVRQAIASIAKAYGLWYREDEELRAVRVLTALEFERELTLFRDEETRVFTMHYPNAPDVALAIRNLYGGRVSLALDRRNQSEELQELTQRFQRFDLLDRRAGGLDGSGSQSTPFGSTYGAQGLLPFQPALGLDGVQPSAAREAVVEELPQEPLSARQIEALQELLEQGGREVDPALLARVRGQQATIFVTVLRKHNQIAVRSADRAALEEIERVVKALDVPTPQVLLEIRILELDLGDDFQSAFDFEYSDSNGSSVGFPGTALAGGGSLLDPGVLAYRYLNGDFQARLQLLQDRNRVTTIATPLLLVANNEVARLFIGEERPIVQSITSLTSVNANVVTTTPRSEFEYRPVGTTLYLTPSINADRSVTLRVLQENSEIDRGGASIPIVTSDGGEVVSTPIDVVRSRTIAGTVVAHDGRALALGGLVQESLLDVQSGVPLLMDLPLVGVLFRSESKVRRRAELVVVVRPYVLLTAAEGERVSAEVSSRLSQHPAPPTSGAGLGVYSREESLRAPFAVQPALELLEFQSGLPGGE